MHPWAPVPQFLVSGGPGIIGTVILVLFAALLVWSIVSDRRKK